MYISIYVRIFYISVALVTEYLVNKIIPKILLFAFFFHLFSPRFGDEYRDEKIMPGLQAN